MDHIDIIAGPYADGRSTALALKDMGIRVVIAPAGLELVSRGPASIDKPSPYVVGPKFQPRDELGRFVPYWVLPLEITDDFLRIEEDCLYET